MQINKLFYLMILYCFTSIGRTGEYDPVLQKIIELDLKSHKTNRDQTIRNRNDDALIWRRIGPQGGRVECLQPLNDASNRILLGTANNGLYIKRHDDFEWTRLLTDNPDIQSIHDIAASNGRIYIASHNSLLASEKNNLSFNELLYYSHGSFSAVESPPENANIVYLALYGNAAGSTQGILKSSDGGETWHPVNLGLHSTNITELKISPHSSNILLAGTLKGAYINRGAGDKAWNIITGGLDIQYIYCAAFDKIDSNKIYLGTEKGLYISSDFGDSWQLALGNAPDHNIRAIEQSSDGKLLFAGTEDGLYRTDDSGQTWEETNDGLLCRAVRTLVCGADDNILLGTADGFYFSGNNGDSWQRECTGLYAFSCQAIAMDSTTRPSMLYVGTDGAGVYRKKGDTPWERLNYFSGFSYVMDLEINHLDSLQIYLCNIGSFVDSISQTSFSLLRINAERNAPTSAFLLSANSPLHCVASIGANADTLFVGSANGIFASNDRGHHWSEKNDGLTAKWIDVLVHSPSENRIYCGAQFRNGEPFAGLYRSLLPFDVWTPAMVLNENPNASNGITHIKDIAINNLNTRTLYMASPSRIWKSVDGGETISPVRELTGVYEDDVAWLPQIAVAVNLVDTSTIITGGFGCHISTDAGETWQQLGIGLESITGLIQDVMFDPNDPSALYAATSSEGVWKLSIQADVNFKEIKNPHTFLLQQNYPNPFNATTVLRYRLPKDLYAKLTVYDISGRKVATLVNSKQSAGNHRIEWDGSNYASGIYFYRLTAGQQTFVKRMTLLK